MDRNLLPKKTILCINIESWKKHKYYTYIYLLMLELKIS